jgi:hypothetical protein
MSEFGTRIVSAMQELVNKLEAGDEIEMTEVRRVHTPDGPMHLRRKVRMNEKNVQRCIVFPIHFKSDHPTTPSLQVAEVGGHQVVVGRHYDEGTLGIFLPDGAIVPDKLASEMRVLGKLAGKRRNRVKARDFLGVFSEGLFYGSAFFDQDVNGQKTYDVGPSWNPDWIEGQDVTEEIGVTF